jgi:hypothetical protein
MNRNQFKNAMGILGMDTVGFLTDRIFSWISKNTEKVK